MKIRNEQNRVRVAMVAFLIVMAVVLTGASFTTIPQDQLASNPWVDSPGGDNSEEDTSVAGNPWLDEPVASYRVRGKSPSF